MLSLIAFIACIHVHGLFAGLNSGWYVSNRLGDQKVGANEVHGDGHIREALQPAMMAARTIYCSVSRSIVYSDCNIIISVHIS
jgi:hypothetical protein